MWSLARRRGGWNSSGFFLRVAGEGLGRLWLWYLRVGSIIVGGLFARLLLWVWSGRAGLIRRAEDGVGASTSDDQGQDGDPGEDARADSRRRRRRSIRRFRAALHVVGLRCPHRIDGRPQLQGLFDGWQLLGLFDRTREGFGLTGAIAERIIPPRPHRTFLPRSHEAGVGAIEDEVHMSELRDECLGHGAGHPARALRRTL